MLSKNISLLLLTFAILTSCNNNNRISTDIVNNPITANGGNDISSLPKFQFETDNHDFGKIIQGEKVTYSFQFKNVGKSDLVITGASGSCGCTVPSFPKNPIAPGKSGKIDVQFNSEGKKGIQNKTINVSANTQPNTVILKIKVEIVEP
ncbi:MAG: hypothetical protein AUJ97_04705 [Bacteroidetes bacterium CG2_30_32_10]|nr:MAG: hypothetical protein AUJ97_04705 [Bacteroidetes bacterium CG2_30_32_10]